jgi:uncharacterized RDD family membrane protein YckC
MDIENVKYAGFWVRVAARIVDGILAGIATLIVMGIIMPGADTSATGPFLFRSLLSFVVFGLYAVPMEASARQATLGKMLFNLKVVDLAGNRLTPRRAAARYVARLVVGLTLGIGYLMVAWTRKKQGLHDKIAETLVVKAA